MTLRRTNVSSEPFRRVYMLPTACILDRTLDVYSNTFCAGGNVLGNGTWVIFGGNQRKCAVFSPFRTISDALFTQLSQQVVSPLPMLLLTAILMEEVPSE